MEKLKTMKTQKRWLLGYRLGIHWIVDTIHMVFSLFISWRICHRYWRSNRYYNKIYQIYSKYFYKDKVFRRWPLPFLNREIFEKMKKECSNIKEWIITASGFIQTIKLQDFVEQMKGFEDLKTNRISLYGNK